MNSFPTLSIHQFDEQGVAHECYINSFSDHIARHHAHVLVPHRHDFYVTVYFIHGSGFHEIDFQRYAIQPGALFFMQPGQLHHWEFTPETEGFVLLHSRNFFDLNFRNFSPDRLPFFFSKRNSPLVQLQFSDTELQQSFQQLQDEYEGALSHKHAKIAALVRSLYIDLARIYETIYTAPLEESDHYAVKFRELETLIDTHYLTQKSAGFYADALSMSTRHVNRICQQVSGKTFSQVLTERTMLEAKHLLVSTDRSFNAIAFALGYEEYAYFSRLFKQYCGTTPKAFRSGYN